MGEGDTAVLTVFVIDDDASIRDSLALMLGLAGYSTRLFADAEDFASAWEPAWSGCVVADLRLPRMSGLELQAWVRAQGSTIPFVIITAHGDVPAARTAFRARAVDFLEKPFDDAQLRNAIDTAFAMEKQRTALATSIDLEAEKLQRLTTREREVLKHAAQGLHAKEIAAALGISVRTVEVHKTRIMDKLEVRNLAELVRFAVSAERRDQPTSPGS
jgi:two-component system, LuxR family, response regulator FixJ